MASHSTTIAKAAFTAACLRADIVQVTRDDISQFHAAFESAVSNCTPSNVQTCRKWLVDNITLSAHRATALGKYLGSFSKNIKPEESQQSGRSIPVTRKRLHILYILNDVLHHVKHHNSSTASKLAISEGIQAQISDLFQLARSGERTRVNRRLEDLLDIWEKEQYFSKQTILQTRKALTGSREENEITTTAAEVSATSRELPYVMPATHGDPTVPYYDLPAANLMPHIVSNKSIPMRPDQIKALQLSAGPADEGLVHAVKDFLKDVERMENPYRALEEDGITATIDELGQVAFTNEADEVVGDTYYGWSRDFCQKMKKRAQEEDEGERGRSPSYSRSRSISPSRSHSFSRSPPKRRRYESRSRSPVHRPRYRSRSMSGSPDKRHVAFEQSTTTAAGYTNGQNLPYLPIPLGPNGLPVPPPRPPNYSGPWPPTPPNLAGYPNIAFPPSLIFPGTEPQPPFVQHGKRH